VRKTLGLVCTVAALCVMSWAQQPEDAPLPGEAPVVAPQYPRAELFLGPSYGYTDVFNAGIRANLYGGHAQLQLNVAKWMGFVFEGSGYTGTSKIPTAVPRPFPRCPQFCPPPGNTFDVNTRLYNFNVGAIFPYRKSERWTPFGEVLFGHSGVRGEALGTVETSGGLSLIAGGGADYNISPRWALRFKADYLQTKVFNLKQDNVRFSVGVVIRTIHHKKRTLEDENPPQN
jgi:outer membrane protein with beta-barrel domain